MYAASKTLFSILFFMCNYMTTFTLDAVTQKTLAKTGRKE